jgi:DNA-binding response OmpR family regulator
MLMTSDVSQDLSGKSEATYQHSALVLDDNDGNRALLNFVMKLSNLEITEASTAQAALAVWKPETFSFAFLDIELPDINGLEVARRIRASDNGVAIVMCSTNDDPVTINSAVEAGCDVFLVKPFQLDTLMNLVKVMNRGSLRATTKVLIIDNTARHRWELRPAWRTGDEASKNTTA